MNLNVWKSGLLFAVCVLGGCAESPIDDLFAATDAYVSEACECPMELGFESRDACIAEFSTSPSQRACTRDVFADNEAEAEAAVVCGISAADTLTECTRAAACDTTGIQECLRGFAAADCPSVPDAVQSAFDACDDL